MTEFPSDTSIESLALRALDRSLPKREWTHAAHFALALYLLRHRPDLAEPAAMREVITHLNEAHGTPNTDSDGYHHTITVASLRAARSVLEAHSPDTALNAVLGDLMASPFARPDWILAYWSRDRLFSVGARRDWVPPDLRPMPI
ncbi:hypothetical protein P7228_11095 [Altererythrobacter arenosus]|uniref:Uncharacterized protein n=1 Tax=Altererythrobacter arenosus TaxID=3032592 RepID=A0ABY8FQM2_9SPHN|nr:hypothetical protein [Altererythrobacter sp. CAU 1644]WFL76540.1 hypothetical protein P7228_11095 [Altererythrobacter sp. CAU 1644]